MPFSSFSYQPQHPTYRNATTVTPIGIARSGHTNGNGISNSITNVAADGGGDDFDPDYGLKFTVKVRGRVSWMFVSAHTASRIEYAQYRIYFDSFHSDGREETELLFDASGAAVRDDTEREPVNAQRYTATAARENLPTSSLTLTWTSRHCPNQSFCPLSRLGRR
jgi:hypothetical protein